MKSYWIWNYGDYEIYHANKVNSRRQEYGADYPCFWRMYDVDRNIKLFSNRVIESDCVAKFHVSGIGYLLVDGKRYAADSIVEISKGYHEFQISVTDLCGLPTAFLESDDCVTDGEWFTVEPDGKKIPVGFSEYYDSPVKTPDTFPFEYKKMSPSTVTERDGGVLYDFGRELFGYLYICGVSKEEKLHVSYGESLEEALDTEYSVVFEELGGMTEYKLRQRAFRYIFISGAVPENVYAEFEYLPLEYKGSFECDDESVNKIWEMCAYTLHLTSREVQLEAIKRDRWLWGGDAYQAYKFNNYLFYDKDIIKRSTIALRGKEPFTEHINTITDYSFYWVIGLAEYYLYYGDMELMNFIYPRAVSLMEFASKRVNSDGFIAGVGNDWIFIDWADIDKDGAQSAEQILYIAANRAMAHICDVLGEDGSRYKTIADEMTKKTNEYFWREDKGAYIDTYESGKEHVTRHANILAVMYDIATPQQRERIVNDVLLNDEFAQITTPYFEGYELDVFGKLGMLDRIEKKIKTYWRGMSDLGATTVWEEYDPSMVGTEHYKMYGGKYAKSLCHAWGAAPIYLLGRYFIGVEPSDDGYESFTVKPYLGSFGYIKGTVPIKGGEVRVELDQSRLTVLATRDGGTLIFDGKSFPLIAGKTAVIDL